MSLRQKFYVIFLGFLELFFIWIPFELNEIYNTHLGFMRQILYMNEQYPISLSLWLCIFLLAISLFLVILNMIKTIFKNHSFGHSIRYVWLLILSIFIFVFLIIPNNIANPMYYYDLLSFSLVLLLQLLLLRILHQKRG